MKKIKNICVYCSSNDNLEPIFFETTAQLGALLAQNCFTLVYGGANVGLMGEVAKSVKTFNGKVIGIIPEKIKERNLAYEKADELIITKGMRERKALMESRSDAFVIMAGGFGTMDEFFEIITMKQLQYHNKPIIILNTEEFYNPLIALLEHFYANNLAKSIYRDLYYIAKEPQEVIDYLNSYQPVELETKWV